MNSRAIRILLILVIAEITSAFEGSMVYAALPAMMRQYGDPGAVGWVVTGYLLVATATAAVGSRLGDLFGRSRLLGIALLLAMLGSVISAFASELSIVVFGRVVQGASAAILPLCFGLVREHLPASHVPFGIGVLAATASVAAGAGMLLSGVIVDQLGWQWIFWLSAAVAVAGMLALVGLPGSQVKARTRRIDVVGGVLFVPAIGAVLYAITRSPQWGWLDLRTGSLLVGSALLLWLWVRHELRHPSPLIDVRLLAQPQIALANIAFALIAAGAMQLGLVLFPLLQQPLWTGVGLGLTATLSGVVKLPSNLVAIIGSTWSGAMAGRRGARVPMLIGTGLLTASWGALLAYHESVWFIIAATIVAGLGMSMSFAAVPNLIVEVAPAERTSEATGMSTVTRAAAMAVGAQLVASMLASSIVSNPALGAGAFPTAESYQLAIGFIAVCSLLAFVVSLQLPKRVPSIFADAEAAKVG